ncbi:MAG: hypothetical protein N4A49_05635 [Marinifilaceae bacterium]|jgi:hypothetical protein|nr:hypothetical protein [Marinifilaceae bacterium]
MKLQLKNIICFILLAIYLAGICGVQLIQHSCKVSHNICYAYQSQKHNHAHSKTCQCHQCTCSCCSSESDNTDHFKCDFKLLYLKTNPNSLVYETVKAPIVQFIELIAFNFSFQEIENKNYKIQHKINDYSPPEPSSAELCCFIC